MSEMLALAMMMASAAPVGEASAIDTPTRHDTAQHPTAHLSPVLYPETVVDETQYVQWLAQRTERLLNAAGRHDDPRRRVELKLAAVNWMLAAECEPPMSRILQSISLDSDVSLIADLTRRSFTELDDARAGLERYRQLPEHDAEAAGRLADSIDVLAGFAEALRACTQPDTAEQQARQAASELSIYLEDDRPDVAAAALLLQAILYAKSDRLERAMRSLPLAVAPPRRETIEYDFFARILRCRYLVDEEAFAAAWALLLMLEEQARDWFVTLERQTEAARSTVLAKLALCDAWVAAADEATRSQTRSWCDAAAARLQKMYFSPYSDRAVARLSTAAPIIIEIPDSFAKPPPPVTDPDGHASEPQPADPAPSKTTEYPGRDEREPPDREDTEDKRNGAPKQDPGSDDVEPR